MCEKADVILIIGTTGEIMPASRLPYMVDGVKIEINIEKSLYTDTITDIFLKDKATIASEKLETLIF